MINNNPIGILDSGIGGLSIWQHIQKKLPFESTIYLADSLNCPYGEKNDEEIFRLAKRLIKFLIREKVKLIIIGCNTISVACLDRLRKEFLTMPIVGTVPAIKKARELTKNKKIGIFATKTTAHSYYMEELIRTHANDARVISRGNTQLVPWIEEADISSSRIYAHLQEELDIFVKEEIDTLVLGCSHFPFIKHHMQKILGENVRIVDSGEAIAKRVRGVLEKEKLRATQKTPKHTFYTTGSLRDLKKILQILLEKEFLSTIHTKHIVL